MEKKFLNAAEIEVVKLDMADIIATSCGNDFGCGENYNGVGEFCSDDDCDDLP